MGGKRKALLAHYDVELGLRLRRRRIAMEMSQEHLGESLGITFQQIQKYEKGSNRIACATLIAISKIMQVPITYFFEGLADTKLTAPNETDRFLSSRVGAQSLEALMKLGPRVQKSIVNLAEAVR